MSSDVRTPPTAVARRAFAVVVALVGLLALLPPSAAMQRQRGPSVTATLASGVVRLGETSAVTIVVEGTGDARLVEVPRVEGVTFGRPQPSSFQSIVNGRVSVQVRYEVPLRAEAEGDYTLPPFVVSVAGEELRTRPLELRVVRDLRGEDLGFLEIRPSSTRVVEGQPLSIEVRLGLDQDMNFAQPILPWWEELPGTVELESRPQAPGAQAVRLGVNGAIEVEAEALGTEEREGRAYRVFRLERRLLPVRSGTLEVPRSHVEFGRTTEERGLIGSRRRVLDRFYLSADPFEVEVVPLPTEGQPVEFGGAVGTLEASARTDTRDVLVGDSIKLTVDWTGEGNLEFFDAPDPARLDAFRDFDVYGKTEEKSADRRRVTYDLAPRTEDVDQVPGVPLTVYDPREQRYVTVTTDPIPVRVRPLEGGGGLPALEERTTVRDIHDVEPRLLEGDGGARRVPGDAVVAGALIGVPLALLGLRTVQRRRAGDPARPAARRRRRAARALRAGLARDASPPAALALFAEYLGARTGEPAAAWEGRDARAWNAARPASERLPDEVASALDATRARLEAAAFGGAPRVPAGELVAVARGAEEAGL